MRKAYRVNYSEATRPLEGAASDWDKAKEVESGKFKVERKSSSLFILSTFHFSLVLLKNQFIPFHGRTRYSRKPMAI